MNSASRKQPPFFTTTKTAQFLIIVIGFALGGCSSDEDPLDVPELVRGTVELYDEWGQRIERVDSVSILITHDGGETYTTITRLDGEFLIDVKGEWTRFWISRPSFATRQINDLDTDYMQDRVIRLGRPSSMAIRDLTVSPSDCGALPCVDLSFSVNNYLLGTEAKRFFELEVIVDEVVIGRERFFAFQASTPGVTVIPQEGNSAQISFEFLRTSALENVTGQDVTFRVYGATHNTFHQDFTVEETDFSRNEVFGEDEVRY